MLGYQARRAEMIIEYYKVHSHKTPKECHNITPSGFMKCSLTTL